MVTKKEIKQNLARIETSLMNGMVDNANAFIQGCEAQLTDPKQKLDYLAQVAAVVASTHEIISAWGIKHSDPRWATLARTVLDHVLTPLHKKIAELSARR